MRGQVWRAAGRGRGSSRPRHEPVGAAAADEADVREDRTGGSEGHGRPEALDVVVEEDVDRQNDETWYEAGWRYPW